MKCLVSHLTPFLPSPPQALRVFPPLCLPLSTDQPARKPSVLASPLFSGTYELPPLNHRFASPAFSSTSELLFSQAPCFQKHLRCPLVFSNDLKISRLLPTQKPSLHPLRLCGKFPRLVSHVLALSGTQKSSLCPLCLCGKFPRFVSRAIVNPS